MAEILIGGLVVGTVALTIAFTSWKRDRAERVYTRSEQARKAGGAVILVLIAWTFLRSGNPFLIAAALAAVALATVYVVVEQPHETLV